MSHLERDIIHGKFGQNPQLKKEAREELTESKIEKKTGKHVKIREIAGKMRRDPNDSDSLKEYSRRDPSSDRPLFRFPEGNYKKKGDRYIRDARPLPAVIHDRD